VGKAESPAVAGATIAAGGDEEIPDRTNFTAAPGELDTDAPSYHRAVTRGNRPLRMS